MENIVKRPSQVLQEQLTVWRKRRRLNQQQLADRIKEDGGTLTRVAISKIETGDRSVSLDEWLQLAYALAVPPPLLFLDLIGGEDVAIVPSAEVHPWLAWQWVIGDGAPVTTSRRVKRNDEWVDAARHVLLYEQERDAAQAVHKAQQAIWSAEYTENPERIQAAKEQHVEALRGLAEVLNEMVERDMNPPGKPREWVELMRNLDMLKYPNSIEIFEPDDGEV
ncbi:helix-turn-helix transcriptional regulator [Planomonospora sp. ID82291]|uniref:helix-turn-helix transcriptional regulator n=1 Tax=Planomonospora sp. ID82291 TaxID=2738136 RepID=UPI0018C371C0|nr:helix-turn-helix transcriptional regulator [Planomonospora sp. ID82291]MBG0818204.1 helix-turn-helix transcriptional regulator [Planomonospora sp. ID82291]